MDWDKLVQLLVNGVTRGSVYALVALGFSMIYGILQLLNLARGDVLGVGEGELVCLLGGNASGKSTTIADRGYVLSTGRIVLEGKASELIQHEELRKAYLGR